MAKKAIQGKTESRSKPTRSAGPAKSPAKKSTASSRREMAKRATRNTTGRTPNDVEFSQDHLSAAAEFARQVGGIDRARGLIEYLASNRDANPMHREGLD